MSAWRRVPDLRARLYAWLEQLGDQFWLRPAFIVALSIAAAEGAIWLEQTRPFEDMQSGDGSWGYSGGAEGARGLLGAVAASSIGVASTIFSITIAALSLASGQMGPRLLRNFVRDARNQIALGVFVGTFAYALVVLRTVRGQDEGGFVPHAAVTGAIALAVICVATLVWFVHHVATSINVERVIEDVHDDLLRAVRGGTLEQPEMTPAAFTGGLAAKVDGNGYLQAVDLDGLADRAREAGVTVRLRVRAGDYVPPGLPVAVIAPAPEDLGEPLGRFLAFGSQPVALQDLEYSVRQLTEIAVRALSPGINDPFTAVSVLERFGDALCRIAPRFLPTGAVERDGRIVLLHPVTTYRGLGDAMFQMIRQSGSGSGFVLIRLIDVLTKVAEVEPTSDRLAELGRQAELAGKAGRAGLRDEQALADLQERWKTFETVRLGRPREL